jgi:hypothetical protein
MNIEIVILYKTIKMISYVGDMLPCLKDYCSTKGEVVVALKADHNGGKLIHLASSQDGTILYYYCCTT